MANLKDNMKEKSKKVLKSFSPRDSGGPKNTPPQKSGREMLNSALSVLFILLMLMTAYSFISDRQTTSSEIPISEVAADVARGDVSEIQVSGEVLTVVYAKGNITKESHKEPGVALSETLVNYGVSAQRLQAVKISVEKEGGFAYWLVTLLPFLIPILFIVAILWFLSRQVKGAGMQAFNFGQSKPRIIFPHDKKQKVTFKDVAGVKEAKQELAEIVDFLKNPKKFLDIGAQIPKGVLLMGAAGTGKTLLARAVAGEAGVPFFSISGSEFVEMFVGVGASRVRDLFKMAKQAAPSIIFIDEIDAVGRVRGSGMGGGNDEREQTLNQILVEMDGFEQHEKVIVMAATNRPDVLDPALVRPGRFDRRVMVDLPDRADRESILAVHALKKQLGEDVVLRVVAERTPGFSGADLYSIVNEAAILAARENRTKLAQFDLIRSIEKVMMGPERKSHLLSQEEKKITAYHEAGHALVSSVLPYADPVHKVSIIARGRAGGYTLKLPLEDRKLQSRKEFLDDIAVTLAGYVTERMIFGDLTTGPSNDLQVSTALARDMVTKYGMSDKIGPIALEGAGGRVMFGRGVDEKEYSQKVGDMIDSEVSKIMSEARERAEEILIKHKPALDAIAHKLIEVETLEQEEYEKVIIAFGIMPKKKKDIEHQK
ncbi:MAG: ATP-dependent zinc metalloprotease FtsH [bacterium]|nr:ATP-dependent zinc metalloprotease FtsH [bacterium]